MTASGRDIVWIKQALDRRFVGVLHNHPLVVHGAGDAIAIVQFADKNYNAPRAGQGCAPAYSMSADRSTAKQCSHRYATQTAGPILDVQYRAVCHAPAADLRSRNSS